MADESSQRPEGGDGETLALGQIAPLESQSESAEIVPDIPEELLGDIPPEHRGQVVRAFSSLTRIAGPVFNPVSEKITPEHISGIIDNVENESVREHEASSSRRKFQFAYFALGGVAVIGLLVFFTLTDNRDLLPPIVTGLTGFLGGLAVGQRFRS